MEAMKTKMLPFPVNLSASISSISAAASVSPFLLLRLFQNKNPGLEKLQVKKKNG